MEGWPRWREHRNRGSRFRAEIEMDRGSSAILPRGSGFGFAAAVREPLVKLQRPKYEFERWDWGYFAWPHDRLDANIEMRDSDPEATLEADRKASESFLNRSMLLLERYAMHQHAQEEYAAAWPRNQLDVNLEMRGSDAEATLEADWKAGESFLSGNTLQLETCETDQRTQGRHKEQEKEEAELRTSLLVDDKPVAVGRRSTRRRRGCAEANRIMHHGGAMQGSWAC
ncbi:uncharacterized protein LOC133907788 [Phragmites australis]|uniref:uncharacterized protein LOC133907788 n=1 Tax=Phragmites australis TaxID=29695 RepID=UPI002D7911ED|nr:uncharacterized protein LOC133907788 [Phragmites australis]